MEWAAEGAAALRFGADIRCGRGAAPKITELLASETFSSEPVHLPGL